MSGVRVIFRVKLATFYTHCIRAQTSAPRTSEIRAGHCASLTLPGSPRHRQRHRRTRSNATSAVAHQPLLAYCAARRSPVSVLPSSPISRSMRPEAGSSSGEHHLAAHRHQWRDQAGGLHSRGRERAHHRAHLPTPHENERFDRRHSR